MWLSLATDEANRFCDPCVINSGIVLQCLIEQEWTNTMFHYHQCYISLKSWQYLLRTTAKNNSENSCEKNITWPQRCSPHSVFGLHVQYNDPVNRAKAIARHTNCTLPTWSSHGWSISLRSVNARQAKQLQENYINESFIILYYETPINRFVHFGCTIELW